VIIVGRKRYAQQLDLLRFQVQEIAAAHFHPDEEAQIEGGTLSHEQRCETFVFEPRLPMEALGENENSLLTQAGGPRPHVAGPATPWTRARLRWRNCMPRPSPCCAICKVSFRAYADKVEVDPARLQDLEERLNLIHAMKRKYGASLAEVIAFGDTANASCRALNPRDAELHPLNAALTNYDAHCCARASNSHAAGRRKVIPQLAKAASRQLVIWVLSRASLTWRFPLNS